MQEIVFFTAIRSPTDIPGANMLVKSLRRFGGELADSPFWVFGGEAESAESFPLEVPAGIEKYYFSAKVSACAGAERLAAGKFRAMVWAAPDCLVVNPPVLYRLVPGEGAALRPVHIRNVGSPVDEEPDGFWSGVYAAAGTSEMTVRSFVEDREIRAYFNSHIFSVDPDLGLMARWQELFTGLVLDREFQDGACSDEWHNIFLHQAVLSAVLARELGPERIRALPPEYNYPYNLQDRIPAEKRAENMGRLVTFTHEGQALDPDKTTNIGISEPLRSWIKGQ